jgi:myo-inositol-1(or 4)-monophosphatase
MIGAEQAELADLACGLAVAAGDAALSGRRAASSGSDEGGPVVTPGTKSTITDLVTTFDRTAEATIVAGITSARPADAIVGEEGTQRPGTSGISWYVDPIDGTTNFVYDLPLWATSIAAADEQGMLVGAVYAPALGELFAATRGHGATLDGAPINCSDRSDLALALIATGFAYAAARRREQAVVLSSVIGNVRDVRRLGSAALDLCYVAAGRFDAYYETGLGPWDSAAGELIAREAGCRTGDHHGGPPHPSELLVATPAIFDALQALLATGTE